MAVENGFGKVKQNNDTDIASFESFKEKAFSAIKGNNKVWAFAAGKGGVGKTFVATSFAITLSKIGHTVALLDLDPCGANVHTSMGIEPSVHNIRNFFEGTKELSQLVTPTTQPLLSYIQGFTDTWTPVNFTVEQFEFLLFEIKKLPVDYVIIDLGAGSSETQLFLMKEADEKFLITSPEPASIERTYRFIEAHTCYSLKAQSTPEAYNNLIATLAKHRNKTLGMPFSFRTHLRNHVGLSTDLFESLSNKPLRLIVNCCRSNSDYDLGNSVKSVCNKYYDLGLDFTVAIDFDNAVWQSCRDRVHVLINNTLNPLTGQFYVTCKQLIAPEELSAVI